MLLCPVLPPAGRRLSPHRGGLQHGSKHTLKMPLRGGYTVLRTHVGGVMSLQGCFTAGRKVSGGIRASPFGLHVHVGCTVERHCVNWKPQSFALLPAGLEEATPRPVQDTGNILKQGYLEKRSRGKA